jgi:EAL domain-containing protein (putative c-di-GMP-specific phosphodiesterase class I)
MFQAKDHDRGSFQFYTSAMNERALEKLMLENDLRRALERNEFTLHYQPKLNLVTGKVTSFEALIRWNRAAKGMVQPVHFIPVLEDSGLIVPVGEWVIRAACAQMRAWQDAGLEIVPVAVNLAVKQFLHHDIVAVIESALRQSRIDARMLEVEITESDVMQNPEAVIMTLRTLRERRIRVSIDDFGTGYSSLGYLKRLPVDTIKLDRSFVTGLPQDGYDVSIARAVIGMAHSLDLKVVAEGVETEAQRNFLSYHGCDEMQGYLFSRPLPAMECSRFLQPARRPEAVIGLSSATIAEAATGEKSLSGNQL